MIRMGVLESQNAHVIFVAVSVTVHSMPFCYCIVTVALIELEELCTIDLRE